MYAASSSGTHHIFFPPGLQNQTYQIRQQPSRPAKLAPAQRPPQSAWCSAQAPTVTWKPTRLRPAAWMGRLGRHVPEGDTASAPARRTAPVSPSCGPSSPRFTSPTHSTGRLSDLYFWRLPDPGPCPAADGSAAWAGVPPKGAQAACPPAGSIVRAAPSAALLGPSAPSRPLACATSGRPEPDAPSLVPQSRAHGCPVCGPLRGAPRGACARPGAGGGARRDAACG